MAEIGKRLGLDDEPKPAPPFQPTDLLPDWPAEPFPDQDAWLRGWAAVLSSERFRKYASSFEDDVISLGTSGMLPPENLYKMAAQKVRDLPATAPTSGTFPPNASSRRVIWRLVVAALVWRLARGAWPDAPPKLLEGDADGIVMGMRAAANAYLIDLGLADERATR